jgi:hypothetical protein
MARNITLLRDRQKSSIPVERRILLRAALKRHKRKVCTENLDNRYHKSHRTPEQQAKYEARIIDITARRFNLYPGQPFPVEAIVRMALKGVREAIRQYNRMVGVDWAGVPNASA